MYTITVLPVIKKKLYIIVFPKIKRYRDKDSNLNMINLNQLVLFDIFLPFQDM